MDRGAWWIIVHGVTELDMTEHLSMAACTSNVTRNHTENESHRFYSFTWMLLFLCIHICVYVFAQVERKKKESLNFYLYRA